MDKLQGARSTAILLLFVVFWHLSGDYPQQEIFSFITKQVHRAEIALEYLYQYK